MAHLVITIPEEIQEHLSRLCFGIPEAEWNEEFVIYLRSFPNLTGSNYVYLQELLEKETFYSFSLHFESTDCSKQGHLTTRIKGNGIDHIWKQIDQALRPLKLPQSPTPKNFNLALGFVEKVDSRTAEWIQINFLIKTPEFSPKSVKLIDEQGHFINDFPLKDPS